MNLFIKVLIYSHAAMGGLGLISGLTSIVVKKGGSTHLKAGKIFSYSMILSAFISLVIAQMPDHKNLFLSLIGVFTIYMVLAGNRSLSFKSKNKEKATILDQAISGVMLFASLIMVTLGIIGLFQEVPQSILYVFFGAFGILMTLRDFSMYRTFTKNQTIWLKSHLSRMIGALIASMTAFLVSGLSIGTVIVWISPTIVGTCYIIYWLVKLKPTNG